MFSTELEKWKKKTKLFKMEIKLLIKKDYNNGPMKKWCIVHEIFIK